MDHGFRRSGTQFVIFRQAPRPVQPRKRPFHHPSLRQNHEAVQLVPFHDPPPPAEHLFRPLDQLAGVAAIGDHGLNRARLAEQPQQHRPRRHPVLQAGRMHHHRQQIALRVNRDVALATLDLLARVVAPRPPLSAVFTDCESSIARLGSDFRPCAKRPVRRRALTTRRNRYLRGRPPA